MAFCLCLLSFFLAAATRMWLKHRARCCTYASEGGGTYGIKHDGMMGLWSCLALAPDVGSH
jgi:hypothetical protein